MSTGGKRNKAIIEGLSRPFFVAPHQRAQNSIQGVHVWSTTDKFDELMEQVGSATSQPKATAFLCWGRRHLPTGVGTVSRPRLKTFCCWGLLWKI